MGDIKGLLLNQNGKKPTRFRGGARLLVEIQCDVGKEMVPEPAASQILTAQTGKTANPMFWDNPGAVLGTTPSELGRWRNNHRHKVPAASSPPPPSGDQCITSS